MAQGVAVLSTDDRQACIELASRVGAVAAGAQYGVKPATVRAWMSWGKVSGPDIKTRTAMAHRRVNTVLAAADRFEDYLEEIRTAAAVQVDIVAHLAARYAYRIATMEGVNVLREYRDKAGNRWVESDDPEAEDLRMRLRAIMENEAFSTRDAVNAMTKATHDLRLLREQSTENVATSVSFDVAMQPPERSEIEGVEVIEAEEVD